MTIEEAHTFLDNLMVCIEEHPIVADWLVEIADRKTENCSEIPNNCEHITEDGVTCAKYPACDDCLDNPLNKVKGSERLLKGKDEPTISKMEQVEEPQMGDAKPIPLSNRVTHIKDEPKTQMKTQNSNLTFEKADERCKGCNHYKLTCDLFSEICRYEPKDEPQNHSGEVTEMVKDEPTCDTCRHKPKDEPQIYGNEHNCIMTLFGDCSYAETGCGSCEVVEKVRKALDKYKLKDELHIDIHGITDCDFCKHGSEEWDSEACDGCCNANNHFEPKDGRE